jgi:hypothetical protein
MIVAGVREGLASPTIAQAIRDGQQAERILRRDDFNTRVMEIVRDGLIEMSEFRANSIVNTEINRAANLARLEQMKRTDLRVKQWKHRGDRGVTEAGNVHPCPTCSGNEQLGEVSINHVYRTVFKTGGVDGQGGEHGPPGHPGVCHCEVTFSEDDLFEAVATGRFRPWTGGEES